MKEQSFASVGWPPEVIFPSNVGGVVMCSSCAHNATGAPVLERYVDCFVLFSLLLCWVVAWSSSHIPICGFRVTIDLMTSWLVTHCRVLKRPSIQSIRNFSLPCMLLSVSGVPDTTSSSSLQHNFPGLTSLLMAQMPLTAPVG